jgi:hypothetical protein
MKVITAYGACAALCLFLALQSHQLKKTCNDTASFNAVCIPEELAPLARQAMCNAGAQEQYITYYPEGKRSTFAHAGRLVCYKKSGTINSETASNIVYSIREALAQIKN